MNDPTSTSVPSSKEVLSALKDGEISELELRRLLKQVEADPELKADWNSYQTIGSVMRSEYNAGGVDISASVREAIANETPERARGFWKKPMQQFAVAASMAAITLVVVQQIPSGNTVIEESSSVAVAENMYSDEPMVQFPTGIQLPSLATRTVSTAAPASASLVDSEQSALTALEHYPVNISSFDEQALRRHFDRALFEHSSNAASTVPQSAVPLARVPGLELEQE